MLQDFYASMSHYSNIIH